MLRHVPARWSREAPFSACTDSAQSPAHRRTAPGLARLAPGDLFQKGSSQPLLVFGVTGCVGTMSSHELTAPERRYEWKQTETDCDVDRRSNPSRPSTLLGNGNAQDRNHSGELPGVAGGHRWLCDAGRDG